MFETSTIIGAGLLGGSLGMAMAERGLARRVRVWARREALRGHCRGADWCDEVFADLKKAVEGADLVIICTPVDVIIENLREVVSVLSPASLVTDVGSTKAVICREADHLVAPTGAVFIGSHPMAGSERTGIEAARADLFDGRPCLVTPTGRGKEEKAAQLVAFWKRLGMQTYLVSPDDHDEIVSQVSHLPHLVASALAFSLGQGRSDLGLYSGAGLKDTTRIAAGDPHLWAAIVDQNRDEIIRSLEGFDTALLELRRAVHNRDQGGLLKILKKGKQFRDGL